MGVQLLADVGPVSVSDVGRTADTLSGPHLHQDAGSRSDPGLSVTDDGSGEMLPAAVFSFWLAGSHSRFF